MARLFGCYGAETEVIPANGKDFKYGELVDFVSTPGFQDASGYLEAVFLDNGEVLWVHEDGKRLGMPVNEAATTYARLHSERIRAAGDFVVGSALITKKGEVK